MSHAGKEIEIKIQLKESEFFKARERIKKIARFLKATQHADEYFTPPHRNFLEPEFPFEWLSIRKRGGKAILNYKHFFPENTKEHTHCDELEVEVSSPEQLEKIFSILNLKRLVMVLKDRETYMYGDEFEVSLDTVKELGYFIEIEAMKDFGSVESARKAIFDFARSLGIDPSKPDERGYPFMLMEKKSITNK